MTITIEDKLLAQVFRELFNYITANGQLNEPAELPSTHELAGYRARIVDTVNTVLVFAKDASLIATMAHSVSGDHTIFLHAGDANRLRKAALDVMSAR